MSADKAEVHFTPANRVPMLMRVTDEAGRRLVDFYDRRHAFGNRGQFIATYYAEDLLEGTAGLNLHMGVDDWQIDAATMAWLRPVMREAS